MSAVRLAAGKVADFFTTRGRGDEQQMNDKNISVLGIV